MTHRGPDADGVWVSDDGYCAFSHRRLSIIDISDAGKQPMQSYDGRYVITFNGEIYNFLELKPELEKRGSKFRTHTDTEVLIEAYRQYGNEVFTKLDGMFAFALYDKVTKEIVLARDAFGEKPLYYLETSDFFAFASELRALEVLPFFSNEILEEAVPEYLAFQYIGAPRTLYKNVYKLKPAHFLKLSPGKPKLIQKYFEFEYNPDEERKSIGEYAEELESLLIQSIKRRLISDVPLGAFLSGGVDSSTVVGIIAKRFNKDIQTFSIGFEDSEDSEHITARRFAEYLGTKHHEKILTPNAEWFLENVGNILDEPNADSSCLPTYILSQFARERVTVAVSGDGGDEMFGGYNRYFLTLEEVAKLQCNSLPIETLGKIYYSGKILVYTEEDLERLLGYLPIGFQKILREIRAPLRTTAEPILFHLRKTDIENYMPGAVLPKVDRMSMQHSLEVRTPYLSMEIAKFANRLPLDYLCQNGKGKLILREVAYKYLPKELIDLPKKGFGLPLSKRWGKKEFSVMIENWLEKENSILKEYFPKESFTQFLHSQKAENFSLYQVWALLVLEKFLEKKNLPLTLRKPNFEDYLDEPIFTSVEANLKDLDTQNLILFCNKKFPFWIQESKELDIITSISVQNKTHNFHVLDVNDKTVFHEILKIIKSKQKPILLFYDEVPLRFFNYLVSSLKGLHLQMAVFNGNYYFSFLVSKKMILSFYYLKFRSFLRRWKNFQTLLNSKKLNKVLNFFFRVFKIQIQTLPQNYIPYGGYVYLVRTSPNKGEKCFEHFLFENGNLCFYPTPNHDKIRQYGNGRYSYFEDAVFLSKLGNTGLPNSQVEYNLINYKNLHWQLFPNFENRFEVYLSNLKKFLKDQKYFSPSKPNSQRIALLTHALVPGGAERQWSLMAKAMNDYGLDVYLFILSKKSNNSNFYLKYLEKHQIKVIFIDDLILNESDMLENYSIFPYLAIDINQSDNYFLFLKLAVFLKKYSITTLITQLDNVNIIGGIVGSLLKLPKIIMSFRSYNPSHFSYFYDSRFKPYYQTLIDANPNIILTGNSTLGNLDYARWLEISAEKINLVPNIVDFEEIEKAQITKEMQTQVKQELGIQENGIILLGAFRLSEEKNPNLFLDVAFELCQEFENVYVLHAGGDGNLSRTVEEKVKKFSNPRIKLLGKRKDVFQLMFISRLVLLTSNFEGSPNVLLEAQSLGIPVVATDAGGVRDCVVHERTGFISPVGDKQALVNYCKELIVNESKAKQMGLEARKFTRENFNEKKVLEV